MKRIVRLTENDLARIVRRVINENYNTVGETVYHTIKGLIAKANIGNWWNKSQILTELKKLKTCEDYKMFHTLANKRGFDDGEEWIMGTLHTYSRKDDQAGHITNPLKNLGTGLTDEEFNKSMRNIFSALDRKCPEVDPYTDY